MWVGVALHRKVFCERAIIEFIVYRVCVFVCLFQGGGVQVCVFVTALCVFGMLSEVVSASNERQLLQAVR